MNATKIKVRLSEMCTLFAFSYHGKEGNIDPYYSPTGSTFHLYFDGKETDVHSVDDAMGIPFFDGQSLNDIAADITVTEW